MLSAGSKRLYSFLLFDLVQGQIALIHSCTFRWRRYELQAVWLYFCNWALIRDFRRSPGSEKAQDVESCLSTFQPNTLITRLEVKTGKCRPSVFWLGSGAGLLFALLLKCFLNWGILSYNLKKYNENHKLFFTLLPDWVFICPHFTCDTAHVCETTWFCSVNFQVLFWPVLLPSVFVSLAEKYSCRGIGLYRCKLHWETSGLWIAVGQKTWCESAQKHEDLDSSNNAPKC